MASSRPQRAAARKASAKLQTQDASKTDSDSDSALSSPPSSPSSPSAASSPAPRPTKRQKQPPKPRQTNTPTQSVLLPRRHPPTYHTPLLLTTPSARSGLLTWFTTASLTRAMPWRRPFLPPLTTPPAILSQRAYEVYISEIMLQQTRVATVVSYWTAWMARFPTLDALADASEEDVLAAWRGLGYYSRARRIHAAAKMCKGKGLPDDVMGLMEVPGVGRYTAGAVAAIVFGRGEAMVDGNVVRVLSRQMGVYCEGKGLEGRVWEAAGGLVTAVVEDVGGGRGETAGLWGQALMELGSTVCTPKPSCGGCPITGTCRAYEEGERLARGEMLGDGRLGDVEDCGVCAPFEGEEVVVTAKGKGVSPFFADETRDAGGEEARRMEVIVNHARKFPLRKPKKKVREEETLVCALRRADGAYLIHRRPEKGMLAGLWELPSFVLPSKNDSKAEGRKDKAMAFMEGLVRGKAVKGKRKRDSSVLKHVADLGSVPWLFSHLKLTMHVQLFEVDGHEETDLDDDQSMWASADEVERASMGTGMRKCWALVQEHGQ